MVGDYDQEERRIDSAIQDLLRMEMEYRIDFITLTKKFYEKHEDFFRQYQITGMPVQRLRNAERILFLHRLLSRCESESIRRSIAVLIAEGILRLEKLEELTFRLIDKNGGSEDTGRSEGTGRRDLTRVKPDRIAVFGWKVMGLSNQKIADRVGLDRSAVKNHLTKIYETFVPDTEHLDPEERHAILLKSAIEEGFIFSRKTPSKPPDPRFRAV